MLKRIIIENILAILFGPLFVALNTQAASFEIIDEKHLINDFGNVEISVKIKESDSGGKFSNKSQLIVCARQGTVTQYSFAGRATSSSTEFERKFVVNKGQVEGIFALQENWKEFFFHFEESPDGQCAEKNAREPSTFDIQVTKSLAPVEIEGNKIKNTGYLWVASGNNTDTVTESLSLDFSVTQCTKLVVQVRLDSLPIAETSKAVVLCPDVKPNRVDLEIKQKSIMKIDGTYNIFVNGREIEEKIVQPRRYELFEASLVSLEPVRV